MSRLSVSVGIIGIFILLIILRFYFFYQTTSQYINGQKIDLTTTLLAQPLIRGNTQQFSVFLDSKQRVTVVLPLFPQFHYGQTVRISGTLNKRVLDNKRTVVTVYFPQIEAEQKSYNVVLSLASFIRQKVTSFFHRALPSPASNLLLGIVFGIKEDMPKDFFANLRTTGVLHVIAASGMNVAMIGGFLSSVFGLLFRRQIALVFAICCIMFYSLLSGLEPSIVRAAIMGSIAFGAQIFGRQYFAGYALLLSAYTMVLYDPQLMFDIGFQLSFSATMGLITIKPLIDRTNLMKKAKTTRIVIAEDVTTTIAAQIATLPILLVNFGTYSLVSVVVNALILWTVPILMIIGGLGSVIGLFSDIIGKIILFAALPFLLYFRFIVDLFAHIGGSITVEFFVWQFGVAYYLFLIALIVWLQKRKSV